MNKKEAIRTHNDFIYCYKYSPDFLQSALMHEEENQYVIYVFIEENSNIEWPKEFKSTYGILPIKVLYGLPKSL